MNRLQTDGGHIPENGTSIAVIALAGVALLLMLLHWLAEHATDAAS